MLKSCCLRENPEIKIVHWVSVLSKFTCWRAASPSLPSLSVTFYNLSGGKKGAGGGGSGDTCVDAVVRMEQEIRDGRTREGVWTAGTQDRRDGGVRVSVDIIEFMFEVFIYFFFSNCNGRSVSIFSPLYYFHFSNQTITISMKYFECENMWHTEPFIIVSRTRCCC